jgi:hypothetical protein
MSKGSWNAQRGCFEGVKPVTLSPSAGLQGQPTHDGIRDTVYNNWTETTFQPSPVDNQTMYSNSQDFYQSIEHLRSLTSTMSEQLDVLWTFVPEQERASLATVKSQEQELALMSLNLASLIYNASSNEEAQTGSPKPP